MTDRNDHQPPGIIFDMDGTLANTLQDIADAVNVALGHVDLPPCSADRIRDYVGDGLSTLMGRAAGTTDPEVVTVIVDRFREHYQGNYLHHTRLYDGVDEALTTLQRAGCPMAILSNKPHDFTRAIARVLLARWRLVEVLGARPDHPKKPDPTVAISLAEQMGWPNRKVVVVGDGEADVQTARAAGMRCVAVGWGFRDRTVLEAAGADCIIDQPDQLAPALLAKL